MGKARTRTDATPPPRGGRGRRPFGVHVSVAGGIWRAPERAAALGCDCFQLFVGNPRGWAGKRVGTADAEGFREARVARGLGPVIVHMTYLPNLASPDAALRKKSTASFLRELQNARRIGAEFFVLHPGSASDRAAGVKRCAEAVRKGIEKTEGAVTVLLENMAGQGNCLGGAPEELAEIAHAACAGMRGGRGAGTAGAPVAVCFDTAHAFAAGRTIARPGGLAAEVRAYRKAFGVNPIRVMHLNDSQGALGSSRDRHQHIGLGEIGVEAMGRILTTPGLKRVPTILETPINKTRGDPQNLAEARRLALG